MNEHTPVRVGFAMTGSFCTFSQVIDQMEQMAQQTGWQLYPILSPNAYETDTRFGSAQQFRRRIEEICGREIWHTLTQTEPIGPKKLLDVLLVKKVSLLQVAAVIGKYQKGKYADYPALIRHERCTALTIRCDSESVVNIDGEALYTDALDISLVPKALRFFYPKGLTYRRGNR